MFKRLILDHSTAIVTAVAFLTASTIFLFMTWRALRMSRREVTRFENLPFSPETTAASHEPRA